MCEVCRDRGKVTTEGLEVHHIEKLRDDPDGLVEDGNLVCLCRPHHRMADDGGLTKGYLRGLAAKRVEGY